MNRELEDEWDDSLSLFNHRSAAKVVSLSRLPGLHPEFRILPVLSFGRQARIPNSESRIPNPFALALKK